MLTHNNSSTKGGENMKKIVCLMTVIVAVAIMVLPVFAAGTASHSLTIESGHTGYNSYGTSYARTSSGANGITAVTGWVSGTNSGTSNANLLVSIATYSGHSIIGGSTATLSPGASISHGNTVNLNLSTNYCCRLYFSQGYSTGSGTIHVT